MSDSVRSVERALDILLCFSQEKPALSLTQISEQVGMHKSTTHRLLNTLESKHFVMRDKISGIYQLGLRFVELAAIMLKDMDIKRWSKPYLQQLSMESGETVDLAVLDEDHIIYLDVVESPQRVKIAAAVGERLPLYCTATGKAFLAYWPEEQVTRLFAGGLIQYTENTLTSLPDLFQNLRETRKRGFAISKQEFEKDINAVAAPIMDANGCPIAVIAIVGPSFRLTEERMMMLGEAIRETTAVITHDVGMAALPVILPKAATPYLNGHFEKRG